ncbi:MAG: polysaccharide deacetylase family protein [Candidatus Methylacidiphilales bacterium]|nr:polysaccharide deacetylase family protein [Candidatus Methylacidiphilales bacterium]
MPTPLQSFYSKLTHSALLLSVALFLPTALQAQEKNRFNLPETPTVPRFKVTDKVWPQKVGEADLCLWHDDKLAALSLGVDDNIAGEIDWWKEQAALYDVKVTWFVITGGVESNRATGYWKQFRELEALGHGVESHTVTHLHMADPGWGSNTWTYSKSRAATAERLAKFKMEGGPASPAAVPAESEEAADNAGASPKSAAAPSGRPPLPVLTLSPEEIARGIEWEYAESKAQIEKNISGKYVSALAYPGGGFTKHNDRKIAAKVFRVARGARGTQNMANMTDYMSLNAQSSWILDDKKFPWGNPHNILDPKLNAGRTYRGWAILFSHTANKPLMAKTFEFIKENREPLWVGLFVDVAKYGQERDTATLKVESAGPEKITFLLTDEMDDSYFNFPLTVKVRIPGEWKEVVATQSGKTVAARIMQHEGAPYALVQAVPDAGLVTVNAR